MYREGPVYAQDVLPSHKALMCMVRNLQTRWVWAFRAEVLTGIGDLLSASFSSLGRLFSRLAILAASTGSTPAKGGVCSNSWYRIMAKLYTSTCTSDSQRPGIPLHWLAAEPRREAQVHDATALIELL